MKNLVELPCEGSYAHDIWTSLVEFGENLVNVSNQRNSRANLGINVCIDGLEGKESDYPNSINDL